MFYTSRDISKMDNSHFKLILTAMLAISFSVPSTPRMMQMTMMRGSSPGGSYRMMVVERMKKKMNMDMMPQYPAPAPEQSYSAPQAQQEKPTKVVVVKVQPMMMQPEMECIVPVDICKNGMMMPNMMMYGGGGGGDR